MFPPERAPNVACLHATIHTQTIHAPPSCSQRHGGNSRQTDLAKLASQQPFCNGLRASATRFCLCLLPASNGSNVPPGCCRIFAGLAFGAANRTTCPNPHRLRRERPRRPRRFCGRASSGRFLAGARLRTSARDNAKSQNG